MTKAQKPKYPIDLGKTMKDMGEPASPSDMKNETFYPSLHLEWEKPYNFPDEGVMTVKFRKKSEETRKMKDHTMQVVELEVTEILDTEGKETREEDNEESTEDVLDKEMKKVQKKKKKEIAPEPSVEDEEESY